MKVSSIQGYLDGELPLYLRPTLLMAIYYTYLHMSINVYTYSIENIILYYKSSV